jgi:hypothetical protein
VHAGPRPARTGMKWVLVLSLLVFMYLVPCFGYEVFWPFAQWDIGARIFYLLGFLAASMIILIAF